MRLLPMYSKLALFCVRTHLVMIQLQLLEVNLPYRLYELHPSSKKKV
jgi:hypothetical protein